nr:hypothetical protein [Treponemataceae bacterium]
MKKIIALVAGLAMSMTAVFAEHTVGLGLNIPLNSLEVEDEDFSEHGFGFDLSYLFIHESNITAKADVALNIMNTDDFETDENMAQFAFDLGAGYSFLNEEKYSLSALAMFGMTIGGYGKEYNDYEGTTGLEAESSLSMMTFDIGVDVIGKYKFTDHLGAFVNLALRYAINIKTQY